MSATDTAYHQKRAAFESGRQQGVAEGIVKGAQELMDRLRKADHVREGDWDGGDVVEVVEQWLKDHGIDTRIPEDVADE